MTSELAARTPFRVSFGGGGTDIETYYSKYGGLVLSTTIDKYFYASLTRRNDGRVELVSADYNAKGIFDSLDTVPDDEAFRIPRAVLKHFCSTSGLSLKMRSDIPGGTGLGSSCAVSVNLVNLISHFVDKEPPKAALAETAYYIDTQVLGFPIGKQDQYASAFGGLNLIEFNQDKTTVTPVTIDDSVKKELDKRILLFFGGNTRNASSILKQQKDDSAVNEQVISALNMIKELAVKMYDALIKSDLPRFGDLLHESWKHKKMLNAGVSNDSIDNAYVTARNAGAAGGKIAGAGGGGFLMLYCEPEKQPSVKTAMVQAGWDELEFSFENEGSVIL